MIAIEGKLAVAGVKEGQAVERGVRETEGVEAGGVRESETLADDDYLVSCGHFADKSIKSFRGQATRGGNNEWGMGGGNANKCLA